MCIRDRALASRHPALLPPAGYHGCDTEGTACREGHQHHDDHGRAPLHAEKPAHGGRLLIVQRKRDECEEDEGPEQGVYLPYRLAENPATVGNQKSRNRQPTSRFSTVGLNAMGMKPLAVGCLQQDQSIECMGLKPAIFVPPNFQRNAFNPVRPNLGAECANNCMNSLYPHSPWASAQTLQIRP